MQYISLQIAQMSRGNEYFDFLKPLILLASSSPYNKFQNTLPYWDKDKAFHTITRPHYTFRTQMPYPN
jgi:hypothetical protein